MTDDTMAAAVKAAAEALDADDSRGFYTEAEALRWMASLAVTAAAPHLLAPVEAEVQRLSEAFIASEAEVARLRESVTDHHNRELSALRTVERQMVEKAESVAAERRRIAELEALVAEGIEAFRLTKEYLNVPDDQGWVLLPDVAGWSHFDWTTKAAAWIAEGETSTIRDVDPGNAQDARRIAEEDDA